MNTKKIFHAFVLILLLFGISAYSDAQQMDIGVSIGDEGIRGFFLAVGDYYRVPHREVIIIRDRGIHPDEVPVVLFIAQRAKVSPSIIIDLRFRNKSWMDIMLHFGLGPDILYVPVKGVYGPPFGKAYGYYKNKPKKEWRAIILDDADVINLVNLRFISEHYRLRPETVIEMRTKGKGFIEINEAVKRAKNKNKDKNKDKKGGYKGKGKKFDD